MAKRESRSSRRRWTASPSPGSPCMPRTWAANPAPFAGPSAVAGTPGFGPGGGPDLVEEGFGGFRFPIEDAGQVEDHHVRGAFPDGVEGGFPVVAGKGVLLDVAVAADALDGFGDDERCSLAVPVL